MAFVPCEWFYEYMLGDNCNNRCDECFGDKDIRICKKDFEVVGEMLETVTIRKGSWWSLIFINDDHVLLDGLDGHQLTLKRYLFDLYFENFVYRSEIESEEIDMTGEETISIAEEFSEWLEDMAEKYGWDKDDVQDLIRQFLLCEVKE